MSGCCTQTEIFRCRGIKNLSISCQSNIRVTEILIAACRSICIVPFIRAYIRSRCALLLRTVVARRSKIHFDPSCHRAIIKFREHTIPGENPVPTHGPSSRFQRRKKHSVFSGPSVSARFHSLECNADPSRFRATTTTDVSDGRPTCDFGCHEAVLVIGFGA